MCSCRLGCTGSGTCGRRRGTPYNITLGQDLNGDSQFNDRPAFATDLSRASVVPTAFGYLDSAPIAGQKLVPVNYANGPGYVGVERGGGEEF